MRLTGLPRPSHDRNKASSRWNIHTVATSPTVAHTQADPKMKSDVFDFGWFSNDFRHKPPDCGMRHADYTLKIGSFLQKSQ
jgi:hypothetical protein